MNRSASPLWKWRYDREVAPSNGQGRFEGFERIGFSLARQSGSFMIYKNVEGKRVTIPYHSEKVLHPKLLQSILRDANLTLEAFKEILR